jgi:hypothetical protein
LALKKNDKRTRRDAPLQKHPAQHHRTGFRRTQLPQSWQRHWEEPPTLYPDWLITAVYELGRWGLGLVLYTFCG